MRRTSVLSIAPPYSFNRREGVDFTTSRQDVKDDITSTVLASLQKPNHYSLLWVHGPAGIGKTTIIQEVVEVLLRKSDTRSSGACFFFSRENQTTDSGKLFTGLAHDLAHRDPGLAPFIQKALDETPGISDLSLREQCDALLIDPINDWAQATNRDHEIIMIVDGLDGCDGGKSEHLKIISVIHQSFSTLMIDCMKWHWVICSRPEAWIHSALDKLSSDQRVQIISMPHTFQRDVGDYIWRALGGIAGRESRLDNIRWHSAGYFAYAASLITYINGPSVGRATRFRSVTTHSEHAAFKHPQVHMFTQLDALYHDILAGVPPHLQGPAKRILGAISITQAASSGDLHPTAFMLSGLLGISIEELHDALYYLHSVVVAPLKSSPDSEFGTRDQDFTNPELTFYHKSFNEFLRNPSRSQDWHIDVSSAHADLAKCCLKRLSENVRGNSEVYQYAAKRWFIHCWRTGMHSNVPTGAEVAPALELLPELYEFNYRLLPRDDLVDRYFVEWLLWLQELAMAEYLVLNSGPTQSHNPYLSTQPTYILGLEHSNQVKLVPTLENKRGEPNKHLYALGPREKGWDWIRGFKVVPLTETWVQDMSYDGSIASVRQGEGSRRPHADTTAPERGVRLGMIGGGLDYDELVARSLEWEEENIYGGYVSSEEELAALVAALSATEGPSSTDVAPNEETPEEGTQGDATVEAAIVPEDTVAPLPEPNSLAITNSSSEDERGSETDVVDDDDTESCWSWRSPTGSEEMVVVASQPDTQIVAGEDEDSDFELVEHGEAPH